MNYVNYDDKRLTTFLSTVKEGTKWYVEIKNGVEWYKDMVGERICVEVILLNFLTLENFKELRPRGRNRTHINLEDVIILAELDKEWNIVTKYYPLSESASLITNPKIRPAHYGGDENPFEPIKIISHYDMDFYTGNVIKYVIRAGKKEGEAELDDLSKAYFYLGKHIDDLKKKKTTV